MDHVVVEQCDRIKGRVTDCGVVQQFCSSDHSPLVCKLALQVLRRPARVPHCPRDRAVKRDFGMLTGTGDERAAFQSKFASAVMQRYEEHEQVLFQQFNEVFELGLCTLDRMQVLDTCMARVQEDLLPKRAKGTKPWFQRDVLNLRKVLERTHVAFTNHVAKQECSICCHIEAV